MNPIPAITGTFGNLLHSITGAVRHVTPHAAAEPEVSPLERDVLTACGRAYDSTWHAFDPDLENAGEFDARDARAKADADALVELFNARRDELAENVRPTIAALVERVESAQVQLMAFAINRKNRGTPDDAQIEAELKDRRAFREECATAMQALPEHMRALLTP